MFKTITKADILLFFVLLSAGIAGLLAVTAKSLSGSEAVIFRDGEVLLSCPLSGDCVIYIYPDGAPIVSEGASVSENTAPGRTDAAENIFVIENGRIRMASATCSNQVCVHTGAISETHQTIVCLPHRVSAQIRSPGGSTGLDAVTY